MLHTDERKVVLWLARLQHLEGRQSWKLVLHDGVSKSRFLAPLDWLEWTTIPRSGTLRLEFDSSGPGVAPQWRARFDAAKFTLAEEVVE